MKKFSYLLLLAVLSIMMTMNASAIVTWAQEGGAAAKLGAGIGRGSYSAYNPNSGSTNYTYCSISGGALYEPIMYDVTGQGTMEYVILSQTTGINVYDMNCNYIMQIMNVVPDKMPALTDLDVDGIPEVTFLYNQTIYSFEYKSTLAQYTLMLNYPISYGSDIFACGRTATEFDNDLLSKCFTANVTVTNTTGRYTTRFTSYDFAGGAFTNPVIQEVNFTNERPGSQNTYVYSLNGAAMTDTIVYPSSIGYGLIPICLQVGGSGLVRCSIMRSDATLYTQFNLTASTYQTSKVVGTRATGINHYVNNIVNVNNNELMVFEVADADGSVATERGQFNIVVTLSGGVVVKSVDTSTTASSFQTSNFMVSNFDKTTNNYICYVTRVSPSYTRLRCVDNLGRGVIEYNVTNQSFSTVPVSYVAADFGKTSNLCYGSKEGIYCINAGANQSYLLFNSTLGGYTTFPAFTGSKIADASNAMSITADMPSPLSPMLVYNDAGNTYIFSHGTSGIVCGDGFCDPVYENAFSCPTDCDKNSSCLETNPSYICRASCSSTYSIVSGLDCSAVNPAFVCCAPSDTQGCSFARPDLCPQLNATCISDVNHTGGRFLCNQPFMVNDTLSCRTAAYDCIANGFAGCAFGQCYTSNCGADIDCVSLGQGNKCIQGICTESTGTTACVDNSGCTPAEPICVDNVCVKQVFNLTKLNQTVNTPLTNVGDLSSRQNMDALWALLLSGSYIWRLIMGVIIWFAWIFLIERYNIYGNYMITIMSIVSGLVLVTVTVLIPFWFTMTIFMGSLLLLIFYLVLRPKPSAE